MTPSTAPKTTAATASSPSKSSPPWSPPPPEEQWTAYSERFICRSLFNAPHPVILSKRDPRRFFQKPGGGPKACPERSRRGSAFAFLLPQPSPDRLSPLRPRPYLSSSQKKRPPYQRGPSCLGSLAVRELDGGHTAGTVGRGEPRGEGVWPYGRSAPLATTVPWGDTAAWAAKLFSINRICTWLLRDGFSEPFTASALPSATAWNR